MTQHMKITLALAVLRPSTSFKVDGDNDNEITWYTEGVTPPTQAEIDAQIAIMDVQRTRADSYPSIGDQLDMQYHDAVNGTTTWKDAVAKVKADNPKPGGGE